MTTKRPPKKKTRSTDSWGAALADGRFAQSLRNSRAKLGIATARQLVADSETIGQLQARLGAIAEIMSWEKAMGLGEVEKIEIRALARGTPAREMARILRRYGARP